ncbi:MAG: biotin/lipoyl-binding protein [Polyangiaceae bacterium]|nr:biotin/lipoyl-binding protein [Polyangiaceae bacterium]
MRYVVTLPGGREVEVDVARRPSGELAAHLAGDAPAAAVTDAELGLGRGAPGAHTVAVVGHRVVDLWLDGRAPALEAVARGARFPVRVESARERSAAARHRPDESGPTRIASPMPGRVVKVLVAPGDVVVAGQPVVVIEAMKMENELACDRGGTVQVVHCQAGQTVEGGAALVEIA